MSKFLLDVKKDRAECNSIQQSAYDLLIPSVKSALGSVMASKSIDAQMVISDEALTYLVAGKESDVLSGILKLVSVLYCTGDIERAERELKIILKPVVGFTCSCFGRALENNKFVHFKHAMECAIAFCTKFLNCEINCVPCELSFEILRSYFGVDRKIRTKDVPKWIDDTDNDPAIKVIINSHLWWMDYIVVDSVPYLYFLRYKTYGRLQRRTEQLEALFELEKRIKIEPYLGHKETTLNLLGQCLEEEDLQAEALDCYIRSLQHRKRNNAAGFLLCIQLLKLWKKYYV